MDILSKIRYMNSEVIQRPEAITAKFGTHKIKSYQILSSKLHDCPTEK